MRVCKKGGGGDASAHVYLSLWVALVLLQNKACFWLYSVKPFARFLLADFESWCYGAGEW